MSKEGVLLAETEMKEPGYRIRYREEENDEITVADDGEVAADEETEDTGIADLTVDDTSETLTDTTEVVSGSLFPLTLQTGIWLGVTVALALAVAALSAALIRMKRKHRKQAKQVDIPMMTNGTGITGVISIGKLHELGDRESQQDCFAVSPTELMTSHGLLAVVADGMGGLADGDKVSQTVVGTVLDGFLAATGNPVEYSPANPGNLLLSLTERANKAVNRMLGASKIGRSGSTMVAGIIRDGHFHYISVGDSRICLYRDGALIQLNREHIYQHELSIQAMNGVGTLQSAATHPKAQGLTSYLGMGQLKYVDIPAQAVEIRPGDKFILMSDGVYNALPAADLAAAMREPAEQAAERIGSMIREKAYRNQDNYTAVIVECQ